ncbi:MAG: hypothetical protein K0Q49_1097 [Haloplasmataceae bacterium]|jgi:hypothetical protein|nr:hypothetical protein [Haloplasmataceae bacterium]
MEKQYFYSSDNFIPQQMGMCSNPSLQNKYSDCLYPMQPMMPQPQCMPQTQFDVYKAFNIPTQQTMYGFNPQMMYQMKAPVSMESMFLMQQQPELRKGEEQIKLPPVIPPKPFPLPEIKPQPLPVMPQLPVIKPVPVIPQMQPKQMMISIKKTQAQFQPQPFPQQMVCPVEQCMPMPCLPCIPMPCEHFMLPKQFMPCVQQPFCFDCYPQPNECMYGMNPYMGQQQMPFGMFPFEEE